jgi:ferric-dicitrate binding protein FerR (iron transport regulator)
MARIRWVCLLIVIVGAASAHAESNTSCDPWAAKMDSVQGSVEARHANTGDWIAVKLNDVFCAGDTIRVGAKSRAGVILSNDTLLRLDENSVITLAELAPKAPSLLDLLKGIAHFISRVPRSLKVQTPFVNAAIEGTEFVVAVSDADTRVTVFEGKVLTQNEQGEVRITPGETSVTGKGEAPHKVLLAKPRDVVQWALYFPPVFANAQGNIQQAQQLLAVGRVDAARKLLVNETGPQAQALQSIIAVVNNETGIALKLAQESVAGAPDLAASHIALSYAWQAQLDLVKALASAQQATKLEPENALAWARLAELQLSTGKLDQALHSANAATRLNPELSRTQSILGYAYLVRIDIEHAMQAFSKAIQLDQADPLPRLGLGLAKIRRSDLAAGRREIEIAASLDPNNAIIRSYLGKAYYEEKRPPLDADQFAMAKQLDPNDPTPYYYDAIRKQTENNPVGALADLNKSIALNDNRAVYRSSLQLDQDAAARQASIASIYRDLKFDDLAQIEAYDSLNTDFSNASAHRFLAESLNNRERHEIARASEALQSLLLSPIALNPVPPSMSETNPGTLPNAGPSQAGFNEYNNLFVRDNSAWRINGIVGNEKTSGDEIVYSQLFDNTVMSVGQYHYQTDGFRANNDFKQNIFNLFVHGAITPNQSLQFEFKNNEKDFGDRRLNFDPADFSDNRRETRKEDSYRLGYHARLSPQSHLLASAIYQETEFARNESTQASPIGPLIYTSSQASTYNTHSGELQYLLNKQHYQLLLGVGDYHEEQAKNDLLTIINGGIPVAVIPTVGNITTTHSNGYLYNYFNFDSLAITLGISNDKLDDPDFHFNHGNGKFGLQWHISKKLNFRAAAFRTLKRSLTSNQTIEPTQVAGFNQFYDDILGADASNYGLGLDATITTNLFTGFEFLHRDLNIPISSGSTVRIEKQKEYLDRLYVNWLINPHFSLSARYSYEEYKRELQATGSINIPSKVITQSVPLNLTYYTGKQFFTGLTATYVNQRVAQPLSVGPTVIEQTYDDFWIFDYQLGYRLPRRLGVLSLQINNLADTAFNFQDTNFRTGLEKSPRFSHERTYLLKLNLNLD